jgi:predicted nucleic acid-binding protein
VRAVFPDTFYWVALANPADSRHQDAVALDKFLAGALIYTTDEILTEFMTFFSAEPWRRNRAVMTMRKEGIADALTNDQHFEQEGFRALFRAR